MNFSEFRAQFPSAEQNIQLNHAGTSPVARPVAEAVQQVLDELMGPNSFHAYMNQMRRQETLRQLFGRLLNVAPETLALVRNTSHGLTLAAQGLPFRSGENVVVAANEYPSNIYPWQALHYRGVSVRLVAPDEDGQVSEEALMAACDAQTRVLTVSWVQWATGQRMDLTKLGMFCRERGIVFCVDAVQGVGALRLDLGLPIDIAAAGCHKWLLAPGGMGFLYVRPEIFATFLPVNIGWNSVEKPIEWDRLHFDELKPRPERMEEGTPGLLATAGLLASLQLLEAVGFDRVDERVKALAEYTHHRLHDRGMRLMTSEQPEKRSGIVAFRHPALPNDAVSQVLDEAGVIHAVRAGNLRFAPHAYVTEQEIETAVAALPV